MLLLIPIRLTRGLAAVSLRNPQRNWPKVSPHWPSGLTSCSVIEETSLALSAVNGSQPLTPSFEFELESYLSHDLPTYVALCHFATFLNNFPDLIRPKTIPASPVAEPSSSTPPVQATHLPHPSERPLSAGKEHVRSSSSLSDESSISYSTAGSSDSKSELSAPDPQASQFLIGTFETLKPFLRKTALLASRGMRLSSSGYLHPTIVLMLGGGRISNSHAVGTQSL